MTALAVQSVRSLADRAQALNAAYASQSARDLLGAVIHQEFPGRIALVSSFGIEAAVLLHLVASVDPATPVVFLDTGKLFGETLRYRDALIRRLGLADVRSFVPNAQDLAAEDPDGGLWHADPDRCCFIRKVLPLQRALTGFDAWINGRKGHHGGRRVGLPKVEAAGGRIKVNALATWTPQDIAAYFAAADLPRHPLWANGFASIGCMPCSSRTAPGEAARAGRWRGTAKTECGIHLEAADSAPRGE
jgi:phosphoadenosine phosphosulfate reductase